MPIRRGEGWGEPVAAPPGLRLVPADAAASEAVGIALAAGEPLPAIGLEGGSLARTMGGGTPGRFASGREVVRAPVDLWRVDSEGWSGWSIAHVVLRRRWWRGMVVLAMNAQYLGPYDVAPRSHPHDGRLDLLEVDAGMGLRARLQARSRARTGRHVPHPMLRVRQAASWTVTLERPLDLWVDGVHRGRTRSVAVSLHPDPLIVHV